MSAVATRIASDTPTEELSERAVAQRWKTEHPEAAERVGTSLVGDVPEAKPEWTFTVEGPQRFARALPSEVWLLARSYAAGDRRKTRGVFAAIDIRHILSQKEVEKRMRRLERAVAKLNEAAAALAAEPEPRLRTRVLRWRPW